jgi:hypothetical protein
MYYNINSNKICSFNTKLTIMIMQSSQLWLYPSIVVVELGITFLWFSLWWSLYPTQLGLSFLLGISCNSPNGMYYGAGHRGDARQSGFNRGDPRPPPEMKPGDWMCPSCGGHNFSSRSLCFKCSAVRYDRSRGLLLSNLYHRD